jgi:hypothetical protein
MEISPEMTMAGLQARDPSWRQPTARERADANRLRVLQTVAEHGHLRCADLATCWPGAKYPEQMAQRKVRALVDAGELLGRRNAHGGTSYVLTRPGAAALELRGIKARHGLDLASVRGATFTHHALTSRWCLHKRSQGVEAWHEHAIVNGLAPVSAEQLVAVYRKLPDAILIRGNRLTLCETEVAPKSTTELMRIAALVEEAGKRLHPELPYVLAGVCLVFDAEQNHAARFLKAARERWRMYSPAHQHVLAGRVTLARVSLGLPLVWRGCSEEWMTLR